MNMLKKKRLITAALPYVNNIPHLGNLIQVLSADVYARFCRSRGYETRYICGTDEYGTATEARAHAEGLSPQALCDKYFIEHKNIYQWFNISFDIFGRTSTVMQMKIVQELFRDVYDAGYITSRVQKQLYCENTNMFLADRYVCGICPKCAYTEARGDQCEKCGSLLDSLELINPKSAIDGSTPIVRETKHLYLNLPKLLPHLRTWIAESENKDTWSKNAIKMTEAWIRDGLKERAITRDLKWGIPVPLEEFTNKVFYVWFDAPIGYISITASLINAWQEWWHKPDAVELVQFIGKDNIPFHTVLFPCTLLASEIAHENKGSAQKWTKMHRISSTEYLNYESGMFSKSRGVGVFGNDAIATGIPATMWRFYMMYNRPETSDYTFTWSNFQESVNGELINNLSNLCNRTFTFIHKNCDATIGEVDMHNTEIADIWKEIVNRELAITALMEQVELRKAYREIFMLCSFGNKLFQDNEPWNLKKTDVPRMKQLLHTLAYLIRDIAILIEPFTPSMARNISEQLGLSSVPLWQEMAAFSKNDFTRAPLHTISKPSLLCKRLEDAAIAYLQNKFSGLQEDKNNRKPTTQDTTSNNEIPTHAADEFAAQVSLKAAKVLQVENHPNADSLYVLILDDGTENKRSIVSGLRNYYQIDELIGKIIIVVANLKKATFRGVVSNGMLLAASSNIDEENEDVEVLFLPENISPGTAVIPQGTNARKEYHNLKASAFFSYPLCTKNNTAFLGETPLVVEGKLVYTQRIAKGSIG